MPLLPPLTIPAPFLARPWSLQAPFRAWCQQRQRGVKWDQGGGTSTGHHSGTVGQAGSPEGGQQGLEL